MVKTLFHPIRRFATRRVFGLPSWMLVTIVVPILFAGWNLSLVRAVQNLRMTVERDVALTGRLTAFEQRLHAVADTMNDSGVSRLIGDLDAIKTLPQSAIIAGELRDIRGALNLNTPGLDSERIADAVAHTRTATVRIRQRLTDSSVQLGRRWTQLSISSASSIALALGFAVTLIYWERAHREIRTLRGILPICMYCKKIRDDSSYWQQVDHYISGHSDVRFSHGICPSCFSKALATIEE